MHLLCYNKTVLCHIISGICHRIKEVIGLEQNIDIPPALYHATSPILVLHPLMGFADSSSCLRSMMPSLETPTISLDLFCLRAINAKGYTCLTMPQYDPSLFATDFTGSPNVFGIGTLQSSFPACRNFT